MMVLYSEVYLCNSGKMVIRDVLALLCLIVVTVSFVHILTALHIFKAFCHFLQKNGNTYVHISFPSYFIRFLKALHM
jgi:uncharacterized membrane protein YesL